ncbi:MAG: 3-deoxy-manno-octulosonate cytidylyltransferase [Planctomycetota bacterium]
MGNATAIIPARMGSTRFPGKALAAETGTPMVVHVAQQAARASSVGRVVVATDSEQIVEATRTSGFDAVMTGEHDNGTSRVAEAARNLGLSDEATIVNVQGDEPEIEPEVIDAAVGGLTLPGARCSTVASPFATDEDPADPNIVKAVVGMAPEGFEARPALYFSRANAPHQRATPSPAAPLKHVGLYAYRLTDLAAYLALPPTPLEQTEKLEQLRWLEHGLTVAVALLATTHHGIDTPDQYAAFVDRWGARTRT